MDQELVNKVISEIRDICIKYDVNLVGVCLNESISGEIQITNRIMDTGEIYSYSNQGNQYFIDNI